MWACCVLPQMSRKIKKNSYFNALLALVLFKVHRQSGLRLIPRAISFNLIWSLDKSNPTNFQSENYPNPEISSYSPSRFPHKLIERPFHRMKQILRAERIFYVFFRGWSGKWMKWLYIPRREYYTWWDQFEKWKEHHIYCVGGTIWENPERNNKRKVGTTVFAPGWGSIATQQLQKLFGK